MVIVSQWPSRRQGKEHSEPSRMTVAENIAFLVRDHVRFKSPEYLDRKAAGDLAAIAAQVPALFESLSGMQMSELLAKVQTIGSAR